MAEFFRKYLTPLIVVLLAAVQAYDHLSPAPIPPPAPVIGPVGPLPAPVPVPLAVATSAYAASMADTFDAAATAVDGGADPAAVVAVFSAHSKALSDAMNAAFDRHCTDDRKTIIDRVGLSGEYRSVAKLLRGAK